MSSCLEASGEISDSVDPVSIANDVSFADTESEKQEDETILLL